MRLVLPDYKRRYSNHFLHLLSRRYDGVDILGSLLCERTETVSALLALRAREKAYQELVVILDLDRTDPLVGYQIYAVLQWLNDSKPWLVKHGVSRWTVRGNTFNSINDARQRRSVIETAADLGKLTVAYCGEADYHLKGQLILCGQFNRVSSAKAVTDFTPMALQSAHLHPLALIEGVDHTEFEYEGIVMPSRLSQADADLPLLGQESKQHWQLTRQLMVVFLQSLRLSLLHSRSGGHHKEAALITEVSKSDPSGMKKLYPAMAAIDRWCEFSHLNGLATIRLEIFNTAFRSLQSNVALTKLAALNPLKAADGESKTLEDEMLRRWQSYTEMIDSEAGSAGVQAYSAFALCTALLFHSSAPTDSSVFKERFSDQLDLGLDARGFTVPADFYGEKQAVYRDLQTVSQHLAAGRLVALTSGSGDSLSAVCDRDTRRLHADSDAYGSSAQALRQSSRHREAIAARYAQDQQNLELIGRFQTALPPAVYFSIEENAFLLRRFGRLLARVTFDQEHKDLVLKRLDGLSSLIVLPQSFSRGRRFIGRQIQQTIGEYLAHLAQLNKLDALGAKFTNMFEAVVEVGDPDAARQHLELAFRRGINPRYDSTLGANVIASQAFREMVTQWRAQLPTPDNTESHSL